MSKIAHYLQEHLLGEVIITPNVRRYYATDASVFALTPTVVIYPRNENDVRKTTRFTWQLAERGRTIPVTARGMGADQNGAAIGSGIIMVFPGHMNRILELDSKTGNVTVEPGTNFGKLQQALHTHGRFLPPYPSSMEFSTVGGAIGNNDSGEKSFKYGSMGNYVKELRVVLANGEVIETKRLSKRDLNKKLGLVTFEGEIYRALDTLIEENYDTLEGMNRAVTRNTAGYNLLDVKNKDGSFDLTPLFVGSQGTLGIVSEAMLGTEPYNSATTLVAAFVDDLKMAEEIILELRKFPDAPCAIEAVDGQLLDFIDQNNPNQLKGIIEKPYPKMVLLIEFDNLSARIQKHMAKKAQKLLDHYQVVCRVETEDVAKERLWKIRHGASNVLTSSENNSYALPFIDDGIVPVDNFRKYVEGINMMFAKNHVAGGIWGHAGDANLHMRPRLDLSQVGDRQKLFLLMDEYYKLVIGLGGSTSGGHGDGRLRSPYLEALYGPEIYTLLQKTKKIFDPYNTLNPGVKIDVTLDDIKPLLRSDYSVDHLYDHLPR